MTRGFAKSVSGSSPLARGTRQGASASAWRSRFIPTRAGNTRNAVKLVPKIPVHPHSRGEHVESPLASPADRRFIPTRAGNTYGRDLLSASGCGSSPLARGTRRELRFHIVELRFIPTRAGNTRREDGPAVHHAVHPHSRGEHLEGLSVTDVPVGSSPLARGTHSPLPRAVLRHRFIPTRAGNTRAMRRSAWKTPVHPHSRGEHA